MTRYDVKHERSAEWRSVLATLMPCKAASIDDGAEARQCRCAANSTLAAVFLPPEPLVSEASIQNIYHCF
jgi:hypothetical protein